MMDLMELSNDITRFLNEDQYLYEDKRRLDGTYKYHYIISFSLIILYLLRDLFTISVCIR